MGKPNLVNLPSPVRRRETRELTDPLQPGETATFTLEAATAITMAKIQQGHEAYLREWFEGEDGARQPIAYPSLDGKGRKIPERMWWNIACVLELQPADAEVTWNEQELIILQDRMPHAWADLIRWATQIAVKGLERAEGNSAGASPGTSSARPSRSTKTTPG